MKNQITPSEIDELLQFQRFQCECCGSKLPKNPDEARHLDKEDRKKELLKHVQERHGFPYVDPNNITDQALRYFSPEKIQRPRPIY